MYPMGYGASNDDISNHNALSEQDLMCPAIGEGSEVFEEGEHREAVQRNVSDGCLNVNESHNIARRVSVVSSAEDSECGSGCVQYNKVECL